MGIPGLINAIGAGERISLSKLAVGHLERTARPIRVAVDISIWLFQVQAGRGGKNPELRALFYRLLKFLALPVHPLFVYDGREKPPFKRGKATTGSSGNAPIIRLSKILVDLFKFPRHEAPGEAEAECARLQRVGVVDCVMSNDVDALMFGSTMTIMNFSKESASGPATHVTCYDLRNSTQPSTVSVDRAGMILFAMLSGGDYSGPDLKPGIPKCGSKLATEIAKAGFGADLLEAITADGPELDTRLSEWRERLQYELEENESGYFQTKHKAVRIPDTFPDKTLLSYYARPVVSSDEEVEILRNRLLNAWDQDINVMELRQFTAHAFEWNYRSGARKVIRLLAEPLVSHRLRLQHNPSAFPHGPTLSNNPEPMLQKVYKSRTIFKTDGMSELQLDFIPVDVVGLDLLAEEPNPPMPSQSQESLASGDEEEEPEVEQEAVPQSPVKKQAIKRYDPYASSKIWIFETVAMRGIPEIVGRWKREQAEKAAAASKPKGRKAGPRKKGPIDPSMKRGSILKYGTVTKEPSHVSQFKSAHIFEAAITATTPTNPNSSQPHSSQNGFFGASPRHEVYPPQYTASLESPIVNDLNGRLNSCNILTPTSEVKRHPMLSRSRMAGRRRAALSDDVEAEVLEVSSPGVLDSPSPSVSRRVRVSYSNTAFAVPSPADPPSPTPKRSSRRTTAKAQQSKAVSIDELRDILSPMQLKGAVRQPERDSSPSPLVPTTPKRQSRRLKEHKPQPEPRSSPSVEEISPPRIQDLLEKAALDMPSLRKRQSKKAPSTVKLCEEEGRPEKSTDDAEPVKAKKKTTRKEDNQGEEQDDTKKPSRHIRSVVVNDGFWTTESTPERELDSKDLDTADGEEKDGKSSKRTGRKRIPRVSILDLTGSP